MNIDLQTPTLNWINGEWVDSVKHTDSINPATGEVIGTYADGGREEAVLATNAAVQSFGPMIDKPNVARVDKMVEEAIASGAKVLVSGGLIVEGPLASGAFYRPTLLEVTDPKMTIAQEEVFGPVLTMQIFDTEAEAVQLANDSEYGSRTCQAASRDE